MEIRYISKLKNLHGTVLQDEDELKNDVFVNAPKDCVEKA